MSAELDSLRKRIRRTGTMRVVMAACAAANAVTFALNVAAGSLLVILPAVLIVACVVSAWLNTGALRDLRKREATALHDARPRVDWAAVRRMEIEIWGRTFQHEGAPDVAPVRRRQVTWDEDGERYCHEHQREHEDGGW